MGEGYHVVSRELARLVLIELMTLLMPYRMPVRMFLHSELCDGGDRVIVTVLSKTLVLEIQNCHWVTTNATDKEGRGRKGRAEKGEGQGRKRGVTEKGEGRKGMGQR